MSAFALPPVQPLDRSGAARAGATNISLVTFLVPVSAILLGWLFLDEILGPAHAIGMAMIALGLMLIDGRLMQWPRR